MRPLGLKKGSESPGAPAGLAGTRAAVGPLPGILAHLRKLSALPA